LIRKKCFVLAVLGCIFALSPSGVAQAEEPIPPSGVGPATPAELGFTGTRAEIREQAAEIAEPGDWNGPSAAELAPIKEMAARAPDPLLDPFAIPGLARDMRKAMRKETEVQAQVPHGEPAHDAEAGGGLGSILPSLGLAPNCRTSGQRIRLFYVYPRGHQPTEDMEGLKPWDAIARANMKFLLESALSSEGERVTTLNVECYPPGHVFAGYPTIRTIDVGPVDSDLSLWSMIGLAEPKIKSNDGLRHVYGVRNLLFYAGNDPDYSGASEGQVQLVNNMQRDERSANYWNHTSLELAVNRRSWMTDTVVHEILHSFGAVSWEHPLSSLGGHCLVEHDVMCYEDKGSRAHLYPLLSPEECPYYAQFGRRIDCLESIYFRADHGDGVFLDGWLHTRWNTIGAENRFVEAYPAWDYSVPCSKC